MLILSASAVGVRRCCRKVPGTREVELGRHPLSAAYVLEQLAASAPAAAASLLLIPHHHHHHHRCTHHWRSHVCAPSSFSAAHRLACCSLSCHSARFRHRPAARRLATPLRSRNAMGDSSRDVMGDSSSRAPSAGEEPAARPKKRRIQQACKSCSVKRVKVSRRRVPNGVAGVLRGSATMPSFARHDADRSG
jgi:hypothetical protein